MNDQAQVIPLGVTLHPTLRSLDAHEDLSALLASELQQLVDSLGVPGRAEVQIEVADSPVPRGWADFTLHGRTCGVPNPVVTRIRQLIDADPAADQEHDHLMPTVEWLTQLLDDSSPSGRARACRFCALVVRAAITTQPSALFAAEQEAAYALRLPPNIPQENLSAVVRAALDANLSVSDTALVGEALTQGGDAGVGLSWRSEEALINRARPDEVMVHLPTDYLRGLTLHAGREVVGLFSYLRQGLLDERGILVPHVVLRTDDLAPPRSFSVTVNHVTGVPLAGLRPGELLVNASRERVLTFGVPVLREVLNPANDTPNAVVPAAERPRFEEEGLTVWSPLEFLMLGVAAHLRQNAACFVDRRSVDARLAAEAQFRPVTIRQLRELVDQDTIVHTIRSLVRDGIPVVQFHEIVERLLDATIEGAIEQQADLVQYLREGLPRIMTARFAGRFRTFSAYVVDPAMEEELRADPYANATSRHVLEALRSEVDQLPFGVSIPGLLAARDIRARLQEIVLSEFPRVPVLTYAELPADVHVQPIARLTLSQQEG